MSHGIATPASANFGRDNFGSNVKHGIFDMSASPLSAGYTVALCPWAPHALALAYPGRELPHAMNSRANSVSQHIPMMSGDNGSTSPSSPPGGEKPSFQLLVIGCQSHMTARPFMPAPSKPHVEKSPPKMRIFWSQGQYTAAVCLDGLARARWTPATGCGIGIGV